MKNIKIVDVAAVAPGNILAGAQGEALVIVPGVCEWSVVSVTLNGSALPAGLIISGLIIDEDVDQVIIQFENVSAGAINASLNMRFLVVS